MVGRSSYKMNGLSFVKDYVNIIKKYFHEFKIPF